MKKSRDEQLTLYLYMRICLYAKLEYLRSRNVMHVPANSDHLFHDLDFFANYSPSPQIKYKEVENGLCS